MKVNKRVSILIVMVIMILFMTQVMAKDGHSLKTSATADKLAVSAGETVTVTMRVYDINMGNDGINVLLGVLDYDRDVFEEITSRKIQPQNGWGITYNSDVDSEKYGSFLAQASAETEDVVIFSISFTVKSNVKENKTTTITFREVTSNDGVDIVDTGDKVITIELNPVSAPIETPSPSPSNKPSTSPSSNPTKTPSTSPSSNPTGDPEYRDPDYPTTSPSVSPSSYPSTNPSISPSSSPKTTVKPTTSGSGTLPSGTMPQTGENNGLIISAIIAMLVVVFFGIKAMNMRDIR